MRFIFIYGQKEGRSASAKKFTKINDYFYLRTILMGL